MIDENDLVYRLEKRAEIRRQIATRKSVQEGKPDRIADLLEEAATEIERLRTFERFMMKTPATYNDRQGGSFDQSEIDDTHWK